MSEMSEGKYRILSAVATVAAIGIGGGGYVAWQLLVGEPIGGPCDDASDCRGFGPICLRDDTGSYCSTHCDGPADCAPGFVCESARDEFTMLTSTGCARAMGPVPGMPGMTPWPGMTPMPMMPMTPLPGMTAFPQ